MNASALDTLTYVNNQYGSGSQLIMQRRFPPPWTVAFCSNAAGRTTIHKF